MWNYFYFILISRDVAQGETFDRVIESCASDVTYSKGVRGDILLYVNLIKLYLISAIHLRAITIDI